MVPPRRLAVLTKEKLLRLTEARLLSYRKKALSLENCPEKSDYSPSEIRDLDSTYIWFKSDPRWEKLYAQILDALARVQSGFRRSKGSRRIIVRDVEYSWWAKGNDGWISIGIKPANNVGSTMFALCDYHETNVKTRSGYYTSAGNQIVVTNRLIKRVIDLAIDQHHYDPMAKGKQLNLGRLEKIIKWDDAVRANRKE